ncbi:MULTISPECIES: RNA polymerase sigma factor [Wolbachia]|uniref:RNA polymerase sigma factor n=1 Tax=Wolbachia TaxID=953 RepID=UPI000980A9AF|nr:sigma-70 family RNA polymerase sigma factor [Wolbachia pipientis]ONI58219.1 RNA polymerase sigma factor, sigma-70 family protein [Wolbachia pipientis wVitA]
MKNSYQGIDSTIVKHVRFQASRLKSKNCFINESLEDIEQELFCQVWQYLNQHDEKRSSFSTFVARLANYCARNMLRNQLCLKRNITFDDINDDIPDHRNSEIEAIIRNDINNIISTLSEKDSNLCQLLKVFTITEASVITKIPKTTIYRTLKRIRDKFSVLEKL